MLNATQQVLENLPDDDDEMDEDYVEKVLDGQAVEPKEKVAVEECPNLEMDAPMAPEAENTVLNEASKHEYAEMETAVEAVAVKSDVEVVAITIEAPQTDLADKKEGPVLPTSTVEIVTQNQKRPATSTPTASSNNRRSAFDSDSEAELVIIDQPAKVAKTSFTPAKPKLSRSKLNRMALQYAEEQAKKRREEEQKEARLEAEAKKRKREEKKLAFEQQVQQNLEQILNANKSAKESAKETAQETNEDGVEGIENAKKAKLEKDESGSASTFKPLGKNTIEESDSESDEQPDEDSGDIESVQGALSDCAEDSDGNVIDLPEDIESNSSEWDNEEQQIDTVISAELEVGFDKKEVFFNDNSQDTAPDVDTPMENLFENQQSQNILSLLSGTFGSPVYNNQEPSESIIGAESQTETQVSAPNDHLHSTMEPIGINQQDSQKSADDSSSEADLEDNHDGLAEFKAQFQQETPRPKGPVQPIKSKFIEGEAEVEEDEFMNYGGVDGEDFLGIDEYEKDMLEDGKVKLNTKLIMELHQAQSMAKDQADVSMILQDITSGALRKRRGKRFDENGKGLDIYDSDEENEALLRQIRKRMGIIAQSKKKGEQGTLDALGTFSK